MVFHQFDADGRSAGYEHRIDEEQKQGSEKEIHLKCRQTVADSAERRHEGCGYGHAGNDIAFDTAADGEYAGSAAEETDKDIIDRRRRACKQFAVAFVDRRDQEEYA